MSRAVWWWARRVEPTAQERAQRLPGDDLVDDPDVVMDRAFTLPAPPEQVWPWFAQLGRNRAGWYLPRSVERLVPPRRRALRRIDGNLPRLQPGDVIDDWPGPKDTLTIVAHQPPTLDEPGALVHTSSRNRIRLSWAITIGSADAASMPAADGFGGSARVQLRLRIAGVRRRRLTEYGGGLVDLLSVVGLERGLRERLAEHAPE